MMTGASAFTLLSNLVISVVCVLAFGFVGPAMGTAIAFIPTVAFYCYYIAKASGVPFTHTFPLVGYLRIVGVGVIAGFAGWLCLLIPAPNGVLLPLVVVVVCAAFVAMGSALGIVTAEDRRYALDWVRLKVLR